MCNWILFEFLFEPNLT